MPTIVEVNWDALDRANPVYMTVTDETTAVLNYKRAKHTVKGANEADMFSAARDQVARWAEDASTDALPVSIFDSTTPEPTAEMFVCVAATADFAPDTRATDAQRAATNLVFETWKKDNNLTRPRPPKPVPAPEPEPDVIAAGAHVSRETSVEPPPAPVEYTTPDLPVVVKREESVFADMTPLMSVGKHNTNAKCGWRGAANRYLGMHIAPGAGEQEERDAVAEIVAGWAGHKVVAVANDKGGAGKTPVAIFLAAAMARVLSFPVAMFDNNESAGLAHERVEVQGQHARTAKHLAQYAPDHRDMRQSDIREFIHLHPDDKYHLLASHHPTLTDQPMTRDEVADVYRTLAQFYALTVTDSGNTLIADNWLAMVQHTNQLVVPMVTSSDRDERARAMLDTLDGFGGKYSDLARNAVVAISTWRPTDKGIADEYAERWSKTVREVVVIPFDEHMGSENLRFDDLKPETQRAFLRLAAAVARGLRGVDAA